MLFPMPSPNVNDGFVSAETAAVTGIQVRRGGGWIIQPAGCLT
jgi:hypothetical protein